MQGKFYRRTHLVTRRTCTICLVILSTRLTTRSTRSTLLLTRRRACFFIIFVSDGKFDNSVGVRKRTD